MRILHTMLRVGDLEKSIAFYTEVLGMKVLRQKDYPEGKFTLAFVGYQDETHGAVLELTHNWDTRQYDLGNGYGHIAVEVDDIEASLAKLKEQGMRLIDERPRIGAEGCLVAFVHPSSANGVLLELVQTTHDSAAS